MHARSALFDVYGDHLRSRGNQAPVAALLCLLEPVGIAAPAVRTAISRMVLQGWLTPVTLEAGRGYAATEQATRRLDTAAARIYRTSEDPWDGRWHLVLLDPIRSRSDRVRVRAGLGWLGYAELGDGVWISPWPRPGLDDLLRREKLTAATATAADFDPAPTPASCWDLAALGAEYAEWLARVRADGAQPDEDDDPDRAAFARRFHLVHEWRKFLFRDPGLPHELLPETWPGREAAAHFTAEAARLKPGADRFVDRCLPS
jgi:phenylacetic acid degradation operon negative regulatory protein